VTDPSHKQYVSSELADDGEAFAPGTSHGIMVRMVGHGKVVLEVGCATGYMSRRLTALGNRVTGLDSNAAAVDEARSFCADTIVADLDSQSIAAAVGDKRFDVVVFGDVLEHLRDPWHVLDESRDILLPNGYAVISIPNIAHGAVRLSLLRGTFEYSEYGLLDNTHLRFFTLRSIRELCSRAGYRIETLDRTKVPLFLETELVPPVASDMFDLDVIDAIRRDPEHDTLQFVFRADPVPKGDQLRLTRDELSDSSLRLSEASATIRVIESRAAQRAAAVARVEELEVLLSERNVELDAAYAALERERSDNRDVSAAKAAIEQQSASASEAFEAQLAERTAVVERLRADVRKAQESYRTAQQSYRTVSNMLADHLATETTRMRAESTEIDRKIRVIQKSPMWRAKRLLGVLRRLRRQRGVGV